VNENIFLFFNSFAGTSETIDLVIIFIARYLGFALMGVLLMYEWVRHKNGNKEAACRLLVSIGVAGVVWIAAYIVKELVTHPRPFLVLDNAVNLIEHGGYDSFPSGHTVFFVALGSALYREGRSLGIFFLSVALVVGIARVVAGIHWPLDILGGIILGTVGAYLLGRSMRSKEICANLAVLAKK
jgi:undecaprenyl-diphosphatase